MGNTTNIWNRHHNSIKECEICGQKFKVKWSHVERRKCCSRKCKDKLQSQKFQGQNNPRYGEGILRTCLICKNEYRTSPSIKLKYCSQKCYSKHGETNPRWKGGMPKCEICGAQLGR